MKNLILSLGVLLLVISCKSEAKQSDTAIETETQEAIVEKEVDLSYKLRFYIDGLVKKDTQPKLIFSDTMGEDVINTNPVKGRPVKIQRIPFIFPEEVFPNTIKLTFNDDSADLEISKVILNFNDDRIILKDSSMLEYLNFNKPAQLKNGTLITLSDTIIVKESLIKRIHNKYKK